MTGRTVTTQAELDAALADAVDRIIIDSPSDVWLTITDSGSSHVEARGSSRVEARELSHVSAWGSSHVSAWGSSRVEARELSHVSAWGSSRVDAWELSRVEARGSSRVTAWGSSRVEARELSRVTARGSSHVTAWGSSRVTAWGSSTVDAWELSRVTAGRYVAVHLHSAAATVTGGVIIEIANLDLADPTIWCDYHGVTVADGTAVVYKAVSHELVAGQKHIQTTYTIGETVTATDWEPTTACGHGLHFGVTPRRALNYYLGGDRTTARFLACEITVAGSVPLGDKIKAPSCRVLHEVNLDGEVIA